MASPAWTWRVGRPPQIIVIHRRQIIVNEAERMDQLDRSRAPRYRSFAAHSLQHRFYSQAGRSRLLSQDGVSTASRRFEAGLYSASTEIVFNFSCDIGEDPGLCGNRFVALGEIVWLTRGIVTGCANPA